MFRDGHEERVIGVGDAIVRGTLELAERFLIDGTDHCSLPSSKRRRRSIPCPCSEVVSFILPRTTATSQTSMDRHSPLRLHVPEPAARPGEKTDFSYLHLSPAGAIRQPPLDASGRDTEDLAYSLIRVLDDDGKACGPWDPKLTPEQLKKGLRGM